MTVTIQTLLLTGLGGGALAALFPRLKRRLELSRAKHRSLAGHPRIARRLASFLPFYQYDETRFFCCDDASPEVAAQRRAGFMRLAEVYRERFAATSRLGAEAAQSISDMQFTERYRTPFQFSGYVARHLPSGAFLSASSGVTLTDLDGNVFHDLAASYGVNVFGNDFYKETIAEGAADARALGPVLGAYHTAIVDNVRMLREISGLDEISFHMSGTEAVMQAVRLARYHTRRSHLLRFCGAYHGWWGDVQPGIGNPAPAHETYTLSEMSPATLHVLRTRNDIACVLVNPLQALAPNAPAPADSSLVDSARSAHFDKAAYTQWLKELRAICSERGIVLIFDEVLVGFRLARGGAQEYFGVKADLVTYGKTLGGGFPVGVLCGRKDLMRRFREDRPGDICFARGTFNSHPYVICAMRRFLQRLEEPSRRDLYRDLDSIWDERARRLNARFETEALPVRVANMSTIWMVSYTEPSRYNWMLQYYLRAEGLALPWTGTGRLIFSLNYKEEDFAVVADRFIAAAKAMRDDGWWRAPAGLTNKTIRRGVLKEMILHRLFGERAAISP
ncbi:aminotransferase class III-fold pyridoxal phosphate-dependent enzyme [Methylocystis bryophila]|uniref:Glutamate-1-semialdehyde 2,1-aminomutase n=1 Tax=Methylocystis bryophila TaxID=655015 RepID=A0A1W6MXR6_9HYPH|nr:aminotransferase class III-fold pyridoxal phosphate-dependent enzyme [Methylocystis bryophila]ARN82372.1 glutamate-1-semialdehyde 2,1-aminomutase [Methylocystis bryophila]BDV38537.1 glutamate-1-semialdehyde 2,1-aminomutase [Methylocystis bryophila]